MADKSGASRLVALMKKNAKTVQPDPIQMCAVSGQTVTYKGMELDAGDVMMLEGPASERPLADGDTVLVYKLEGDPTSDDDDIFFILGRVVSVEFE